MSEETKTRRVRRVAFSGPDASFGVEFTLPSGAKVKVADHTAWPGATITKVMQYGITQLYQDGLARGKAEAPATDDDAREILACFESGDWSPTRGDGRPTMQAVAARMVRAKFPGIKGDDLKAKVTAVLDPEGNPKGYATVTAQWEREVASWEAARAGADDLGI